MRGFRALCDSRQAAVWPCTLRHAGRKHRKLRWDGGTGASIDDLEDGHADPGSRAEDDGKVNVLSFLGREGARNRLQRHLAQARAGLRPGGELAMFVGTIFGDVVQQPGGFGAPIRATI